MRRRRSNRRVVGLLVSAALVFVALLVPTAAGAASGSSVPSTFSFSGSGWGHGVGMSQYGARGQAMAGRSAAEILGHYYRSTKVRPVRDDVDLRVNLEYGVTAVQVRGEPLGRSGGTLQVASGATVVTVPARTRAVLRQVAGSVRVEVDGRAILTGNPVTVRWSGTREPGRTGSQPAVLNVVGPNASLETRGHRYRYGHLEVRSRTLPSGRALSAVNVVRLHDEYLLGIGEMPSSWPMAALQTQVIASRSFAYSKYLGGVRAGCWCHVMDGVSDQVFAGWAKESGPSGQRWRDAVKSTSPAPTTGSMVMYGSKVALAAFSSASGGRTQNSEDVWSSAVPYLRSVDDRWSRDPRVNPSSSSWGPVVRAQRDVAKAFGLKDVARLDLSSRYVSGALKTATAWSSGGTKASMSGASFTARLGLNSRWSYPTGSRHPLDPAVPASRSTRPAPPPAADPFAAAVAAAKRVPTTSRTVVLARSANGLNAKLARPLMAARTAPLLLASPNGIPRVTRNELVRRAPKTVYLVDGPALLSATVERQLKALGVRTVVRLAVTDRYSTSAAVAAAIGAPKGRDVFVVNGTEYARIDAVTRYAAATARPVLLVGPTSVPSAVAAYLKAQQPRRTTVSGPPSSVSDAVLRAVPHGIRTNR